MVFRKIRRILPFVGNVFHISIDCIHHGSDDISAIGQSCQIEFLDRTSNGDCAVACRSKAD